MGMIATVSHCPSINWDQVTGRIFDMTKARARERAKARKGKKRQAPKESPDQQHTLDKLHNVDRTVESLSMVLDQIS